MSENAPTLSAIRSAGGDVELMETATDNPMVFNGPIGSQWLELGSNSLGTRPDLAPAGVGKVEQNASSSSTSAPSSQGKASDRTSASGGKNSAPKMHTPIDSINDLIILNQSIQMFFNKWQSHVIFV